MWAEIVEEIGPAPVAQTGIKWVSVGDAASDIFSYLRRTVSQGWHALIRVSQDLRDPDACWRESQIVALYKAIKRTSAEEPCPARSQWPGESAMSVYKLRGAR